MDELSKSLLKNKVYKNPQLYYSMRKMNKTTKFIHFYKFRRSVWVLIGLSIPTTK